MNVPETKCKPWSRDQRSAVDAEAEARGGSVATMLDPADQPMGFLVALPDGRKIDSEGNVVLEEVR